MDSKTWQISSKLVPENYLKHAKEAMQCRETAINELLKKRKLPENGWADRDIESFINQLSQLDSNNFERQIGLGEREGRIYNGLVAHRHYNFSHGIGRSGDLNEAQPKAAGSTLMSHLTNELMKDVFHSVGLRMINSCILSPMATCMTLTLCMLTLKKKRPESEYVIWSRVDQKGSFKSIITAGLKPIVIDINDNMTTDCAKFEEHILAQGAKKIACLMTTTSCFAPRNCDNVESIGMLAKKYDIPHLVNNAYGLQCTFISHQLETAMRNGANIDLIVQSTDKNLMVPVGGAIIAGPNADTVEKVAQTYAGRASSSVTLDVLMTLLSMGRNGFLHLIESRKKEYEYLLHKMEAFANKHGETVIQTRGNRISIAMTLNTLKSHDISALGSMLYTRKVSGARTVIPGILKTIDNYDFLDWGTHRTELKRPYITAAAGIGILRYEIDIFLDKLESIWDKVDSEDIEKEVVQTVYKFQNQESQDSTLTEKIEKKNRHRQ